jgi:hypothetical protein
MTRFVEQAIARAGLAPVLAARAQGDVAAVRALLAAQTGIDLLVLGAVADEVRTRESGALVRVHSAPSGDVMWVADGESELDLLRQVALARITGPVDGRVGVDWTLRGLEIAQVALGFGASDLCGPITRKSGALIGDEELKKVKGQGMVARTALRRKEIAALIRNAGRECEFSDEAPATRGAAGEVAHA